jgi:peptidoglycan/LPS O-acetylase OafA/YrhL
MPGLDGLRALAVLAVIAYHLGLEWAPGGLLGVGVFFTLSGYLITDILLAGPLTGRGRLRDFWFARARRLLPALFVMLAVVVLWVVLLGPVQSPQFGKAVAAAALYVSNWQLIFQHVSYFARFGPPSPLNHLWSLGVEEQFYIFWPLLLVVGIRFVGERSTNSGLRPRLAAVTLVLAAASAAEMALLYHPSLDPSRLYFGTDTRAFELLAGAALAMVWPSARLKANIPASARRLLDFIGVVGLVAVAVLVWRTDEYSPFLYRGGFVLLSLAVVMLLAALVHPACRLGRVLGVGPLRWIGVRSYGIYLWHVPILVLTTPAAQHQTQLWRAGLQVAATLIVAGLSWRFVEQPIRRGALTRLWKWRSVGWRETLIARHGLAAIAGLLALLAATGIAFAAGLGHHHPAAAGSSTSRAGASATAPASTLPPLTPPAPTALASTVAVGANANHAASPRTSCHAVTHIGDSTSDGLTSPAYLPIAGERIEAQYALVGVKIEHFEISGARSIVETLEGLPNAQTVAQAWKQDGYHGCWVLALGTNDTANVYVGSSVGRLARIQRMMSTIGHQPVMWVNVKSLLGSGPYSEQNMELWNNALLQACHEYPNMRVFDWASVVQDAWFIDDGIHYNTPGYAARSRLIAQALAHAFPAHGSHPGCLVR